MAKRKSTPISNEYGAFLGELKDRIATSRIGAARAVNRELIRLYWSMGESIVQKQRKLGWGEAVVEKLSKDLLRAFPDMRGLSPQNLWRMRQFYLDHTDPAFRKAVKAQGLPPATKKLSQPVREVGRHKLRTTPAGKLSQAVRDLIEVIPWGHHANVLSGVRDPAARAHYLQACAMYGWSRNVLLHQVKAEHYERTKRSRKLHNFNSTLPKALSELAEQTLKSNYNIEFIGAKKVLKERHLEDRLIARIQEFILELGYGFCFIGRQFRLVVSDKEYYVDLLFYHRFLRSLVAVELKLGSFEPEHGGKMDFYLNVLNDTHRAKDDNPSIGIILCGKKNDVVVEYSLRGRSNPIGVAGYRFSTALPAKLRGKLPSADELQAVLLEAINEG